MLIKECGVTRVAVYVVSTPGWSKSRSRVQLPAPNLRDIDKNNTMISNIIVLALQDPLEYNYWRPVLPSVLQCRNIEDLATAQAILDLRQVSPKLNNLVKNR